MRLTTILLFVGVFQLLAINTTTKAQNTTININANVLSVGQLLDQIEHQSDYLVVFRNKEVDTSRVVSFHKKSGKLETYLDEAFKGTDITYSIDNKYILLYRKSEKKESPSIAQQEGKRITGTIIDKNGEPIIGANVVEKGTTNGTITDANGKFTLNVSLNSTLVISYIGYTEKNVSIGNSSTLAITLDESSQNLDEVVVVGFGTQKKVNLTGSVSALSTKDINKIKVTQTSQLLSGLVSGINVTQSSGQPGNDQSYIRIHGLGTFSSAGNEPLVLIDGLSSSLDNVNVNDIESISVLKDAASSAIYGTRAANGVILIKTKSGQDGKFKISYQGDFGFSRPAEKAQIVDSWVYAEMYNEALMNAGASPQYSDEEIAKFKSGEDLDNYPNKRHYNDLINSGSGFQTNHHLSFTGGTEKNSYMFSFSYLNQEGIVKETNYDRYNVLFNVNSKLLDNLKVGVKFSGLHGKRNEPTAVDANPAEGVEGLINYSIKIPNTYAGKRSDGYYGNQTGYTIEGWMDSESFIKNTNIEATASTNIEWNILKNLKLTGIGGYTYESLDYKKFLPTLIVDQYITVSPSNLTVKNTHSNLFTLQAYLDYDLNINSHLLHILGGYSQESYHNQWLQAYRDNFPNNSLYEINAGAVSNQQNSGSAYEWALASFFWRLNYSFKDRYLFEANARYDGSSRFPKSKRFGLFPSLSAGWIISQEGFFHSSVINNLKLRASWGKLGNQNIGNYPYQQVLTLGMNAPFGVSETLASGAAATVVPSSNITWESTADTDIGADIALFNNKLNISTDLYYKKTSDILYNVTASTVLGMTPSVQNAGEVTNKGIDFTIQHRNAIGNFNYSITANFSYVKNEVTKLANIEQDVANGLFVGHALESIYGFVVDGVFCSQEEIDNYAKQPRTAAPGDLKLVDISGPDGVPDGKVDFTYDRKIIGDQMPSYNFGLNLNAQYKNFDFLVSIYGVAGMNTIIGGMEGNAFLYGASPQMWMVKEHWTKDNPNPKAGYPRFLLVTGSEQQFYNSTFNMQNASFLRINDVQVGYSFISSKLKHLGMSNLRIYASVKNLITFDHFKEGWDPEFTTGYPPMRDFMAGINISF